jgi:hypothetical protein
MKITIMQFAVITALSGMLMSCATTSQFKPGTGNKYRYSYRMTKPVQNTNLLFRDDSIIIQYKFDDAALQFQLQNISESSISIDWEKASLGIAERYYPVRHASNFYTDSSRSNSILIPPMGFIREVVIPRENIYSTGDVWAETDLLPTTDQHSTSMQEAIRKNVGKKISLVLPMILGTSVKNYQFDFQVDAVKQIPWKDFTPVKRVPPPPKIPHTAWGNVTAAIIVVGVLGFSAYALSVRKIPPTE